MRVKDLRVGSEYIVNPSNTYTYGAYRAIVLDTKMWIKHGRTVWPKGAKMKGRYATEGVPVARLCGGEWKPEVVLPSHIRGTFADHVGAVEAAKVRRAEAFAAAEHVLALKAERNARLVEALKALGIDDDLITADGDSVRITGDLVNTLESLVNAEVAK